MATSATSSTSARSARSNATASLAEMLDLRELRHAGEADRDAWFSDLLLRSDDPELASEAEHAPEHGKPRSVEEAQQPG